MTDNIAARFATENRDHAARFAARGLREWAEMYELRAKTWDERAALPVEVQARCLAEVNALSPDLNTTVKDGIEGRIWQRAAKEG